MKVIDPLNLQIMQVYNNNTARSLFTFGSITKDTSRADRDIGLVVDINESDPLDYFD